MAFYVFLLPVLHACLCRWAILAGVLLFGERLEGLYFIALVAIVAGLLVYNCAPQPMPLAMNMTADSSSVCVVEPVHSGASLEDSTGKGKHSPLRAIALGLADQDELQRVSEDASDPTGNWGMLKMRSGDGEELPSTNISATQSTS